MIVDGSGGPGRRADLGVSDGRVIAIGDLDASTTATTTIDARDRIVAPGFIDIHTHYDAQILWDRLLSISPWHGVTTVVIGNCGFGLAPTRPSHRDLVLRTLEKVEGMSLAALEAGCGTDWAFETFPQYLDAIERRGMAINVGALIGHTPLRLFVMGEAATERAATADEIDRMRAIVKDAVAAGALGFASSKAPTHVGYGGKPVPSRQAAFEELLAIAGALGELRQGIIQSTAGPGLFFDEFETLARETGRPVTWTALLAGMMGPGSHRMLLQRVEQTIRAGLPVHPQVACRPLVFEFDLAEQFVFESMPIFQPISAADRAGKARLYRDPAFRQQMKDALVGRAAGVFPFSWERVWITWCPSDRSVEQQRLSDVARDRGVDPVDLLFDLGLASDLTTRFRQEIVNFDEDEVAELLLHPDTIIGLSDAGAHANQLCDACFATHLLGHWVRERGTLTLEQAVWMLTGRAADFLRLPDRGRLLVGRPADITVFDPTQVGAGAVRRVNDLPAGAERLVVDAIGIDAVIVNGRIIRRDGQDVCDPAGPLPGQLLRSRPDAQSPTQPNEPTTRGGG